MAATTKGRTAAGKSRANPKRTASRPQGGSGGQTARKPRARRSLLASRPALRGGGWSSFSPRLESHQVDILALALIAIGIFLGGVAYAHWNGGALGNGAVTTVRYLFGALGYGSRPLWRSAAR